MQMCLRDTDIRAVILGCGMINVHTVEEALDTDETWKVTKVLRRLMGAE